MNNNVAANQLDRLQAKTKDHAGWRSPIPFLNTDLHPTIVTLSIATNVVVLVYLLVALGFVLGFSELLLPFLSLA